MNELYVLREGIRDECEDLWPDGRMPKRAAERLLRAHQLDWADYAEESGLSPTMPPDVRWEPLLAWMGY